MALALTALTLLTLGRLCAASNWAQVSGTRDTNVVMLEPTPWQNRHGHAVMALDFSEEYSTSTGIKARIFVLGGDTSVQGEQDLRAYPGGGAMKNDVWTTTGISWNVATSVLKTTKWGDPLPQITANLTWLQTNSGKKPPRGVTYADWIACAFAPWAVNPATGCEDTSQAPGSYLSDIMFSPRRNFVAIAFNNDVYVLGGRAREHFPVPEAELRGGVNPIPARNIRWREYSVLKNDVWKSTDSGASWTLVTPGCLMPQANLIHKSGDSVQQCETDDQCEGDSSCKFDETTSTGFCVCNMWSPREYHAVVNYTNALYLSGGYAVVQLGDCGVEENARKRPSGEEFACGGGYRAYMNDIWMSTNGQTWTLLKLHASWTPRGEHSMVIMKSMLYILGGRTGDSQNSSDRDLLNDVWTSSDGASWTQLTNSAPWSPRAKQTVVMLPGSTDTTSGDDPDDVMVLMYGEDEESVLDDIWTWKGGSADWIMDFAPETDAADYMTPMSSVAYLRIILDEHVLMLNEVNIWTITDLTSLSFDMTIYLRTLMPICDYIALAKQVVATCTVSADDYPGKEYANLQVIQGANGAATAAAAAAAAAASVPWDGCAHVGTQYKDSVTGHKLWPDVKGIDQVQVLRYIFDDAQESICRWTPSPRTGHSAVVFQRKIFMLGGLTAPDYYANDAWYRDPRRPKAQFITVPRTKSSSTVFTFGSDKASCIFEYHVMNIKEMLVVRNWTKTLGEVNFISWLDGGKYRFRVRAVDPAGNVDLSFELGRNEYVWIYVPALPWALILGLSSVALVLMIGAFMEWRKRRKRAAMERYAMKRMRRKLKGKKIEGDANWRETYDDAKDKKKGKKRKGKLVGVKAAKAESPNKGKAAKGEKDPKAASKKKKAGDKDEKKAKKTKTAKDDKKKSKKADTTNKKDKKDKKGKKDTPKKDKKEAKDKKGKKETKDKKDKKSDKVRASAKPAAKSPSKDAEKSKKKK